MILADDPEIGAKFDKAIFPGLQGGPLMHVIAGKAVAFKEALTEDYKNYISQVIDNARTLSQTLMNRGYDILTGGTDNHMLVLDLRKQGITGKDAALHLDQAGITSNKNTVPFDDTSPFVTSGVRLGTAACTTRGFKEKEFEIIGNLIADVLDAISAKGDIENVIKKVLEQTKNLTSKFPLYNSEELVS